MSAPVMSSHAAPASRTARGAGVLGILIAPVVIVIWAFAWDALTPWGYTQLAATTVLSIALITLPWRNWRRLDPVRGALGVLVATFALRVALVGDTSGARLIVLPAGTSARLVDRLFEERDATVLGARLVRAVGGLFAPEGETFAALLAEQYDLLEPDAPLLGTPIPATYLGLQTPAAFDTYVFEGTEPSDVAVVFLHGSAGNFLFNCWQVAVSVRASPASTWCPATRARGDWWSRGGDLTTRATIRAAHDAGARHIVLVGVSNGGVGASRLAARLGAEIDGLVLISGLDDDATIPDVPVLLLHGDRDGMMPVELSRRYAERAPDRVRLVELEGTHFVVLERRDEIAAELRAFVDQIAHAYD